MQRIFKYGDTENMRLTPDKEVNNFIHGITSYTSAITGFMNFQNMVRFFWPTLYRTEGLGLQHIQYSSL